MVRTYVRSLGALVPAVGEVPLHGSSTVYSSVQLMPHVIILCMKYMNIYTYMYVCCAYVRMYVLMYMILNVSAVGCLPRGLKHYALCTYVQCHIHTYYTYVTAHTCLGRNVCTYICTFVCTDVHTYVRMCVACILTKYVRMMCTDFLCILLVLCVQSCRSFGSAHYPAGGDGVGRWYEDRACTDRLPRE